MEFSLQAALAMSRLKPELRTTSSRSPLCGYGVQPSGCTGPGQAKAWTPNQANPGGPRTHRYGVQPSGCTDYERAKAWTPNHARLFL